MTTPRQVGTTFLHGRYQIDALMHDGTFSRVYRAYDTKLQKPVALKEVAAPDGSYRGRQLLQAQKVLDSLKAETQLMQGLSHAGIPHIIDVQDDTETPGGLYSVLMDFVAGTSLDKVAKNAPGGQLPEDFVVSKMTQLALILIYLHSLPEPIIYRDLKPGNVMLDNGAIKLLDFGISEQITPANYTNPQAVGTRGYAPPEQRTTGAPLDPRSDIYAFGMTMFVLLTGRLPQMDAQGVPLGPVNASVINPNVSPALSRVIARCVAMQPERRYQSMTEVVAALSTYKQTDEKHVKAAKSRVRAIMAFAVAGLLCFGGAGVSLAYGYSVESSSYTALVASAEKAGTVDGWAKAIEAKPGDIDNYFHAIDAAIQGDGVFTSQDESTLIPLVRDNVNEIQKNKRYPELAYRIGEAYWFFYQGDGGASGLTLSAPWFKDAIDGGYNTQQATALYNLASFNRDIASAVQTGGDTGMYRTYWNNLTGLDTSSSSEVIQLTVLNYILDSITSNPYGLKSDGVTKEDMETQVQRAQTYLAQHQGFKAGRPQELAKELAGKIDKTKATIATLFQENGEQK